MTTQSPAADPSHASYYVTDDYYAELVADFQILRGDAPQIEDPRERDLFRRLLERESRLLDQLDFSGWLTLFAAECTYWVPSTPHGGDPRREIAIMFDDRRRLEDRIFRLQTGFAWSQAPSSRTMHMVSNVEVVASDRDDQRMVRSNILITEFWDGEIRHLAGWAGHRFRRIGDAWTISAKQVNLLQCDQCLRNPSIIF